MWADSSLTLPACAAGKPTDPKLREQAKEVSWTFKQASLHEGLRNLSIWTCCCCQVQLHLGTALSAGGQGWRGRGCSRSVDSK